MFATPPATKSFVDRGELRPIAQTAGERMSAFPELPTFRELGMPELESESWWGLFAPAGTPKPILAEINAQARATLEREDIRVKLETQYVAPKSSESPEAFREFLEADVRRWAKRVEQSGIQL
jgi:tripartite-type tricarboxylate transporter receptor subunit TctC